jgi:hypothetical protein
MTDFLSDAGKVRERGERAELDPCDRDEVVREDSVRNDSAPQQTPIFTLRCLPQGTQQSGRRDVMLTEPVIALFLHPDIFGDTCTRLEAHVGSLRMTADGIMKRCGSPEPRN